MKFLRKIFRWQSKNSEKPLNDSPTEMIDKLDKSRTIRWLIIIILWFVSASVILLPLHDSGNEIFIKDQRAPLSIFAECNFSYVDEKLTESAKEEAKQNEPTIYRIDPSITENIISNLENALSEKAGLSLHTNAKDQNSSPEKEKIALPDFLNSEENIKVLIYEVKTFLDDGIINTSERELRKGEKIRIMDDKGRLRKKIIKIDSLLTPSEAAEEIALRFSQNVLPKNRKTIQNEIAIFLGSILTGNLVYDENETNLRKQSAAESIKPIVLDVKKGQLIMKKGMVIDEETLAKYNSYIAEKEKIILSGKILRHSIVGALLSFIMVLLTGIYMYHIHPEIVRSNKQIGIVAFSAISNIILNAMVIRGFYIFSSIHNLPPYVVTTVLPLAISSVILSVLIGLRVALYTGLFVSLIVAIQLDYSFPVILNGMVTSVVSGFTVRYARNYRDFFIKTLISVSLSMPLMDSLWVIAKGYETRMIVTAVKAGFFSGPFIAVLCIGLLLLIESTFRAYSNMSLITFCDYNHPLLQRMQIEAPGTYHHSLVVSNLAEQAAREIGADPIKARVGALFHDIGKLSKPEYFTENNLDGHNMHEDLSPRMSAIVILNHVKEGIELALKYKLPKIVRDCIQEHHGKDMISFFYKRALDEREENSNIHEWDYRYSGPLPR
ncbi:MAG TPA: HDIG domain-containing protein, partial [Victivallales bacterium]|nr:HDIG domain-containing protein [Victivallales bacterium]